MSNSALYLILAADVILILAAAQDIASLRISNIFSILLIAGYFVLLALVGPPADVWQNSIVFLIVFLLGLALFRFGILGGGDVKLISAAALWFNFDGALPFLASVLIMGGLTGVMFIVIRRMIPAGVLARSSWRALKSRGPIPYGMGIAAGTILALHSVGPAL